MSDEFDKKPNPDEAAFLNALHQRKVVADALKAGTLSCLPGTDGYADTASAINLVNGTHYHGANLLYLKDFQKQNSFPTAEYVTGEQVKNAGLAVREGQKGVSISFSTQNEESGEWEKKSVRLFNVAQVNKPWEMKTWAEQKKQEQFQERLEFMRNQYGGNYQPPQPKQQSPGPEVICSATAPEQYLGQYLAAVSMGGRFKASPEQAAEFTQKMEASLFERMANGHTNPFKLSKISNDASQVCKDMIKEIKMESRKIEQPAQNLEQKHGRSL